MEQLVRVQKLNADGTAQVIHVRQSACSGDCHKCSGCGAVQEKLLITAQNPINAQPGDMVILRSETGPVLLAASVLYLVPLVLFFVSYAVVASLGGNGALGGCLAFMLGMALAVVYDRLVLKKKKPVYTIIGFVHQDP